jgi:uncharacterized protein YegP (UPF0339 family)
VTERGKSVGACSRVTRIGYGGIYCLGRRIAAMSTRYEYDLDRNGDWRWIAIAGAGQTKAISPVGYRSLQDCMHAVGLMQAPGNVAVLPAAQTQVPAPPRPADPPKQALSSLRRRPTAA